MRKGEMGERCCVREGKREENERKEEEKGRWHA
jgi:hypothetical protein